MVKNQLVFKVLFLFLIIYISAFQLNAQSREQLRAEYEKGKIDGELDARSNFGWVVAGFFLPVGSSIATFIFKPDPPPAALLGKSRAYILGYTKAYKSKSARKNLRNTCIGTCALGVVAGAAFVIYDATKADTKEGEEKGWCEDWLDRNCNKPFRDCNESCESCNTSWDKCIGNFEDCNSCISGDNSCGSCSSKNLSWALSNLGL